MPGLSVTAQIVTTDPPGSAFERLETGQLLELECEQLTVGAAAAISLPVGDAHAQIQSECRSRCWDTSPA